MTSRDFCYWLQGYFELEGKPLGEGFLNTPQTDLIRKHLAMVFVHEIDPALGTPEHRAELQRIHDDGIAEGVAKALKELTPSARDRLFTC